MSFENLSWPSRGRYLAYSLKASLEKRLEQCKMVKDASNIQRDLARVRVFSLFHSLLKRFRLGFRLRNIVQDFYDKLLKPKTINLKK